MAVLGITGAAQLAEKEGITTAKQLYGYYLLHGSEEFQMMLRNAGVRCINKAHEAIIDWDDQHN